MPSVPLHWTLIPCVPAVHPSVCKDGCTGSLQWPKTAILGQLIPRWFSRCRGLQGFFPSGQELYRASGKEEGTDGRQKLDRATPD